MKDGGNGYSDHLTNYGDSAEPVTIKQPSEI